MRAVGPVLFVLLLAGLAGCTYMDDFMDRLAPIFEMDTPVDTEVSKPV